MLSESGARRAAEVRFAPEVYVAVARLFRHSPRGTARAGEDEKGRAPPHVGGGARSFPGLRRVRARRGVKGCQAAQTLLSAPAHLALTGSPYICRSFSRRMAQAMRKARSSPYFLIETLVRPFFSRPAFQETS